MKQLVTFIIAANQSAYTEGAGLNAPQEIAATWEG